MKKDNIVQVKSYNFAIQIVELYKYLSSEKKEFILSNNFFAQGLQLELILKKLSEDKVERIFLQN